MQYSIVHCIHTAYSQNDTGLTSRFQNTANLEPNQVGYTITIWYGTNCFAHNRTRQYVKCVTCHAHLGDYLARFLHNVTVTCVFCTW